MAPRLLGHLWKTVGRGCFLILLVSRAVISTQCQREPSGAGDCPRVHCSVSSGSSLHVPLRLPGTLDLYKWRNATLEWDHIYSFLNGSSHQLMRCFQGPVSVSGGDFAAQRVGSRDGGVYKFQELDGACLAWLHLTVLDAGSSNWYLLFLLLLPVLVVLAIVGWKRKCLCQRG